MRDDFKNRDSHFLFDREGFRNNIIMRAVEILNIVLMTLPFFITWLVYYGPRNYIPFYFWGNWAVIVVFFIV